jgi:methionine-rich copper-binding protein CopC
MNKSLIVALVATALFPAAAQAHPKMLSATPAAGSVGSAPAKIELRFSEGLVPAFAKVDLLAVKPAAKIPLAIKVSGGKTVVATPARPLAPGAYTLTYHVTSVDTHRVQASYAFTIR